MSKTGEEISVTNEEKALKLLKGEDFLGEMFKTGAELGDEDLAPVAGGANLKDALIDGQIPLEQPRVSAVHI
jgi:hypothetical protein